MWLLQFNVTQTLAPFFLNPGQKVGPPGGDLQSRRDRGQSVVTPVHGSRSDRDTPRAQVPHAPLEVRRPTVPED
jgi:hypothetical protein